jgi:hypothetical protein
MRRRYSPPPACAAHLWVELLAVAAPALALPGELQPTTINRDIGRHYRRGKNRCPDCGRRVEPKVDRVASGAS